MSHIFENLVQGDGGDNFLVGLPEQLNRFRGEGGNDVLNGKSRSDEAIYSGARSVYSVSTNSSGSITVVDNRPLSPDGTDTVVGINALRFSDGLYFINAAANRVRMIGSSTAYKVANSDYVTGTTSQEIFVVDRHCSANIALGLDDFVDFSRSVSDYSFSSRGNLLFVFDGRYTTTLTYGGPFTMRTASGSAPVTLDATGGSPAFTIGLATVGLAGFDVARVITNPASVSSNSLSNTSLALPTVQSQSTADRSPTLSGSVSLAPGESLLVEVGGATYGASDGLVVSAGVWNLPILVPLSVGVHDIKLRVIESVQDVVGGAGSDVLSGTQGRVSRIYGAAGNDAITGGNRADEAFYSGARGNIRYRSTPAVL